MLKSVFILISFVWFLFAPVHAQCPDRDTLWDRLTYIRDHPSVPAEQLQELFTYLEKINSCSYKNDSTHAFLVRLIGAKYYHQGDFLNAIQYYRQSVRIINERAGDRSINPKHALVSYYWLSVVYDSLNNVTEKMKATDSCIVTGTRLNALSDISCIRALYTRVEHFFDIGEYQRCMEDATICEKLAWDYSRRGTWDDYVAGVTHASSSLGWNVQAQLKMGRFEGIEQFLIDKVEWLKKAGLINYLGMVYGQLAQVQIHKGNFKKAIQFLYKEFSYDRKAGYDFNCKQSLNMLGYEVYFRHYNDSEKGLTCLKNALRIINKDEVLAEDDLMESLNIYTNIANIYVNNGLFDSAFQYFQIAFNQFQPGIYEKYISNSSFESIIHTKKIHYLVSHLIDKGDAYRKKYHATKQVNNLQEAVRIYKATDLLLNNIKTNLTDLKSKLFWRSDSRRLYESAIAACYLLNAPADAFYFFEKSRSVLLQDQLNEQRWLVEEDAFRQTQVKKKIILLERELTNMDKSSLAFTETENKLFRQRQELDQLRQTLKRKNPIYYQSFIDPDFITIPDVQQYILKDHKAFVAIFSGDSAVYSLAVTPHHARISRMNKARYDTIAQLFLSYISDFALLNRNYDHYIQTARELHELIFKDNPVPDGRIIISPDGRYFPFEALVNSSPSEPLHYFVQNHAISYTYSARFLLNRFSTTSNVAARNFMGMAPGQYAADLNLTELPGSAGSLKKLQSYFDKSDNYLAHHASKNNFLSRFHQYRIVQLYTHASAGGTTGEPVIYFSDSALYLSDLFRENKPVTNLIILSACETGLGPVNRGEGVFSFNRGFAAIGIPSSVINLWSVETTATYRITELFYKYLHKGLPIDLALQQAKIEFIRSASTKEYELPYFWAAPVLAGKTDAIELQQESNLKYFIVAAVLIGLLVGGMLTIKNAK